MLEEQENPVQSWWYLYTFFLQSLYHFCNPWDSLAAQASLIRSPASPSPNKAHTDFPCFFSDTFLGRCKHRAAKSCHEGARFNTLPS